jgi:hypothetical protein
MKPNYLPLVTACLTLATGAGAAVPAMVDMHGYVDVQQLSYWTVHRLRDGEFDQVDEALRKFADLSLRDIDGKPALGGVVSGIDRYAEKEALGSHALGDVEAWRKKSRNSTAGILVESRLWYQAAWAARGPGSASHVSDEGWKLFGERLTKAEKILREGHDAASSSPAWYSMYVDANIGLDGHEVDVEKYFREGSARFPSYYELYFAYLERRQWYGSQPELLGVIDDLTRHGRRDEDAALYARLLWSVSQGMRFDDGSWIGDHGGDWAAMRRGFDLIHAQFPHSTWNAANFLAFACRAKDRDSYQKWRALLGEEVERHTADVEVEVSECDRRLRPMNAATENYERHLDVLADINAALVNACFAEPVDGPAVTGAFSQLLAWRKVAFEIIERDKPEMTGTIPAKGALEKVNARSPQAICGALNFRK